MDSVEFIGTATTLIRLGSFTLLTDPNFLHRGQRAYLGKGLWSRRLSDPAVAPHELPALDAIVLSHLHGDHFDRVARRELDRQPPVLTTPHAARRLRRWGFLTRGLSTWEAENLTRGEESLTIRAVPAVHARGIVATLLPPVMGSILELRRGGDVARRVYVTGDTVTGPHVHEIARRYPDIDVAVVHLGGTRVLLHTVTMDTGQAVELLRRTRPDTAIGVHRDDYGVFKDPGSALGDRVRAAGLGVDVVLPARGQTLALEPAR